MNVDTFRLDANGNYLIDKAVSEVKDYVFDWTDWLSLAGNSGIASAVVSVDQASGLAVDSIVQGDKSVTVWVSGGNVNHRGRVTCKIVTDNTPAHQEEVSFYVNLTPH
jgi:hypothetical protein